MNPVQSRALESAIYSGFVRHRRFLPKRHAFSYPLFMLFIRLDELGQLTRTLWGFGTLPWHWARFRRADYLGDPRIALETSVRSKLAQLTGLSIDELSGEVYFFGHLRYLGLYFSPLNLYFLRQEGEMRYLLAEVSNTPWLERHYYALDLRDLAPHDKAFHVSPFNPMAQRYRWQIRPPSSDRRKASLHLDVISQEGVDSGYGSDKVFDATLILKRNRLNRFGLLRVLVKSPLPTLGTLSAIYWQALKLFIKDTPLHAHPDKRSARHETVRQQHGDSEA